MLRRVTGAMLYKIVENMHMKIIGSLDQNRRMFLYSGVSHIGVCTNLSYQPIGISYGVIYLAYTIVCVLVIAHSALIIIV